MGSERSGPGAAPPTVAGVGSTLGGRYRVERLLGEGGFGTVFEAVDLERGERVAVKVLRQLEADALYRFKREFRAMARLLHPNLIVLHELIAEGPHWFFAMEFVDGVDFLHYVHRTGSPAVERRRTSGSAAEAMPLSERRLRAAMLQLATGVAALHAANTLHRDLKPNNVLVTPQGALKILDFGLVADTRTPGDTGGAVLGTPAYMAPEQATERTAGWPTDCYAMGVMLFEALTGRLPFTGAPLEVLLAKQSQPAPLASELAPGCPVDLVALCDRLLLPDPPEGRPTAADVAEILGGGPGVQRSSWAPAAGTADDLFVGREAELAALQQAFDDCRGGRPIVAHLHGRSGIGKSALVSRFLAGRREAGAVVLAGRCYEQESVPYKAIDSLIDALCRYLRSAGRAAEALMPRGVHALAQIFPVLRRADAVAQAPGVAVLSSDPHEIRQRAIDALAELLARIADRQPLVLSIDDLQWGDLDSAELLADLFDRPDPPALLLVLSYRSEELTRSPVLRAILKERPLAPESVSVGLELLDRSAARELAAALLGPREDPELVAEIARSSGGNPFFLCTLAREAQLLARPDDGAPATRQPLALEQVLHRRLAGLAPARRMLLELVAVAGRPLSFGTVAAAAELGGDDLVARARLQQDGWLRALGGEATHVECYHDRVRETAVASLDAEQLRDRHARLALALQSRGDADAEQLATHFEGAGDRRQAASYAVKAADEASAQVAFERAVRLYSWALDLIDDDAARSELEEKHGAALAAVGRGHEAAQALLAAADLADEDRTLELRRLAAEQLLSAGYYREGKSIMGEILREVGYKLSRSQTAAMAATARLRARLRLRGTSFRERKRVDIPRSELMPMEVCGAAGLGLIWIDGPRGGEFQVRYLLEALRLGEPAHVSMALAQVACQVGFGGFTPTHWRWCDRLLARAAEVAERCQDDRALATVKVVSGHAAFFRGRWRDAIRRCEQAETMLRERCPGANWELTMSIFVPSSARWWLGDYLELSARVHQLTDGARRRGDLLLAGLMLDSRAIAYLVQDQPDAAVAVCDQARREWADQDNWLTPHFAAELARAEVALYRGECAGLEEAVANIWSFARRVGFAISPFNVFACARLHARSALLAASAASAGSERNRWIRAARRAIRRLHRNRRFAPSVGSAHLATAGLEMLAGRSARGLAALLKAEAELDRVEMTGMAAAARWRRGQVLGGDQGAVLVAEAEAAMSAQGVIRPQRLLTWLAPGFAAEGG